MLTLLRSLGSALLFIAVVAGAKAQDRYPSQTVRIVVPNPPGGITDILARIIAQNLARSWGQPVIVDNRPGADQMIGAAAVAKSAPDGHTLFVTTDSSLTAVPHLYKEVRYDPLRDFTPILALGQATPVINVSASLPIRSVQELIALAKSKPGAFNYGSFGNGTYAHLGMEDFKQRTGTNLMHIPYKGSAPAITALLRNEISVLIVNKSVVDEHVQVGTVRILAAAGTNRPASFPNLPTVAESGVPGFATGAWWGLFGPGNLPRPIVDRIRADVAGILSSEEVRKLYQTNTLERMDVTAEEFTQLIRREFNHSGALIKAIGLTPA